MSGDEAAKPAEGNEPITIRVRDQVSWLSPFRKMLCVFNSIFELSGPSEGLLWGYGRKCWYTIVFKEQMLYVTHVVQISHNFGFCHSVLVTFMWYMTDRGRNIFQDQEDHQNEQGLPDIRQPKGGSTLLPPFPFRWRTYRTRPNAQDARIGWSRPNRLHVGTIWWMVITILFFCWSICFDLTTI